MLGRGACFLNDAREPCVGWRSVAVQSDMRLVCSALWDNVVRCTPVHPNATMHLREPAAAFFSRLSRMYGFEWSWELRGGRVDVCLQAVGCPVFEVTSKSQDGVRASGGPRWWKMPLNRPAVLQQKPDRPSLP